MTEKRLVNEVDHLASVLFTDGCKDGADHMTLDDFKEQLSRQEGLVKNMGIRINKWLVPPPEDKKKPIKESLSEMLPVNVFSKDFWTTSTGPTLYSLSSTPLSTGCNSSFLVSFGSSRWPTGQSITSLERATQLLKQERSCIRK